MIVQPACSSLSLAERLEEAFRQTFARTERIFACVRPKAYYERPIALRHPINFYEGHLAAFIANTLFGRVLQAPSRHPAFDALFERGIDPGSAAAAQACRIEEWPDRAAVQAYRADIHARLFAFLAEADWKSAPHPLLQGGNVLFLLLEHEWMHQETLLYLIHQLPHALKQPPTDWEAVADGVAPAPYQLEIPAGKAVLGALTGEYDYTWDNERPQHAVSVEAFAMDAFNVTNGDFLAFVEAGGYHNPAFWTSEAWAWVNAQGKTHPPFWQKAGDTWQLRDFFSDRPLPLAWPVYVTQAEAAAYARFTGQALPTEAEWHRAALGDGNRLPQAENVDFRRFSPIPVGDEVEAVSVYGVQDLVGNGWEWTATRFAPFEGFQPSAGYPQYSADFFDGQHYVVKGGSCFTDARLLRPSFRNWYYWHYPYMYAGFRCVQRN